jgi:hypothetical protein
MPKPTASKTTPALDPTCGCGCNRHVPITRPNAARTRKRTTN